MTAGPYELTVILPALKTNNDCLKMHNVKTYKYSYLLTGALTGKKVFRWFTDMVPARCRRNFFRKYKEVFITVQS